jgi:hypothetical protein
MRDGEAREQIRGSTDALGADARPPRAQAGSDVLGDAQMRQQAEILEQ